MTLCLVMGCTPAPSPVQDTFPVARPGAGVAILQLPGRPQPNEALRTEFATLDAFLIETMAAWGIPGASVAVGSGGKLVYTQAYGWADIDAQRLTLSSDRFRIASVSKPITAIAIMQLVEQGKIDLDRPVIDDLPSLFPQELHEDDPRRRLTVRHLLQHRGGWARMQYDDPMLHRTALEARAFTRMPGPVSPADLVRYALTRPLDFTPGTRFAYSNLGYIVLGQILSAASGRSYEEQVRASMLTPLGMTATVLGKTTRDERQPNEVTYYPAPGSEVVANVETPGEQVLPPEGLFSLYSQDAAIGWIATASDLVTLANAFDAALRGKSGTILASEMAARMLETAQGGMLDAYGRYGLGWYVQQEPDGVAWWHVGTMSGTTALLGGTPEGRTYAVLMNSRPKQWARFNGYLRAAVPAHGR